MSEHALKPKRLSLSEILEMVLTRQPRDRSSVTIGRTSSGETVFEVKVAAGEGTEAPLVGDAQEIATDLYTALLEKYPASEPRDPATVSLTRNAKGETQIEVTLRTGDGPAATLAAALELAVASYDEARRKYPMADGHTAKPGSVK